VHVLQIFLSGIVLIFFCCFSSFFPCSLQPYHNIRFSQSRLPSTTP